MKEKLIVKEKGVAECPTCKSKYYNKKIVSVVKCNICGYKKLKE